MKNNVYSLKKDIISHFEKFDILLKFESRNLSDIELYLCFELPQNFFPFDNLEDSKKLKSATKNLFFNNQTFDYCLSENSKIELFNFEYYDF
tara:strand:+ start:293 stop:568 length:276 start_codon:yes stop_codon:yes gene_type:complete